MFKDALAYHQLGNLDEAQALYEQLLTQQPDLVPVLTNLGTLYLQRYEQQREQADLVRGIDALQRSLSINPVQPNLHNNLASIYLQQKQRALGVAHYSQAVALGGATAGLHLMMGVSDLETGLVEQALSRFDAAIALNPGEMNAWYNRGNVLSQLRSFDEALTSYRQCIKLDPNHVEGRINMGVLLQDLRQYPAAIALYDEALRLRPGSVTATYNRAFALENTRDLTEAVAGYDRVLRLSSAYPEALGRRLFAQMQLCDWTEYQLHIDELTDALVKGVLATVPFTLLAMSDDPVLQRACAEAFVKDRFPALESLGVKPPWDGKRRIRVGYFSSDLRTHAVGFLTAGLFEAHDRNAFEVVGFSLAPTSEGDAYHDRIKAACEHWVDAFDMTDSEVVAKARDLGLDIAVDLAGHTLDARTGVFAQRVAPLQVNYLGYPGSMGASYIDAALADGIVAPEGVDSDYTEQVIRLPGCFQVNDRKRAIGPVLRRGDYGLPENGLVLASFNTSYKLNPGLFDVWCRLLLSAPGSVLWLLGEVPEQMQYLRDAAVQRRVDSNRLIFAKRVAYADHLARYAHVDLVLDTWPFNGGTSTSDALWGGAPVLTMTGRSFASRMSASLLNAVGLQELVTGSLDAYEALGRLLINDMPRLAALKANLAEVRLTCPLFDTAKTVRDIEDAYRALLCSNQSWAQ